MSERVIVDHQLRVVSCRAVLYICRTRYLVTCSLLIVVYLYRTGTRLSLLTNVLLTVAD